MAVGADKKVKKKTSGRTMGRSGRYKTKVSFKGGLHKKENSKVTVTVV